MSVINLRDHRLYHQFITNELTDAPEGVLNRLCAIQAQDYSGAKWSLALRIKDCDEKKVDQSIKEKKILRTWLMRGTLHFVTPNDIGWMLKLLAPRMLSASKRRNAELELDSSILLKTNKLLEKALQQNITARSELLAFIEKHGITAKGQRGAHILHRASYEGILCHHALIKNDPQYLLMDFKHVLQFPDKKDALTELTKRYFSSRGPATIQDFVWWSSLTVADAKIGLEGCETILEKEEWDGQTYYFVPTTLEKINKKNTVSLLPGFDEYLIAYKDRSALISREHMPLWCPGNNGMFMPYLVINGKMSGTWKKAVKKNVAAITTEPIIDLNLQQLKQLEIAKSRYLRYLDMDNS